MDNDGDNGGDDVRVGERCLSAPRPTARASPGAETGPYLLQVVKLHRDLPEEEVDVAAPLHRVHEVGLWRRGGGGALLLRCGRDMGWGPKKPDSRFWGFVGAGASVRP